MKEARIEHKTLMPFRWIWRDGTGQLRFFFFAYTTKNSEIFFITRSHPNAHKPLNKK